MTDGSRLKPQEYSEGPKAADAFGKVMKQILTVSKPEILKREREAKKNRK